MDASEVWPASEASEAALGKPAFGSRLRVWDWLLFRPVRLNEAKLRKAVAGKTILITGASSGIGERTASLLGRFEAHLILVARREEELLRLKRQIETDGAAKVSVFRADLREAEDMSGLLAFVRGLDGGLDIVISNAGHSIHRSIADSLDRFHDFTRTMAINYFAPVQLLLTVIPLLERNKGHIVNVSTINAVTIPLPGWSAYQASKSAFDTWLRSAAPELAAAGVSATSVYLPLVRTPMIEPTKAYRHLPAMSAEHAARAIARSLYTRRGSIGPWWLMIAGLVSIAGRGFWERASARRTRKRQRRK